MKTCCKFSYRTVDDALNSSDFETVEDFGGKGEGYSWSDGRKELCRCRNCGALFLNYWMNFLAMTYNSDDKRFSAYLPVASRDEALDYVDKYIGSYGAEDKYIGSLVAKDSQYKGKMIWFDGSKWCWNKREEIITNTADMLENFALLRERLGAAKNKETLIQLEIIRMNALNEFREMTKAGKSFTLGNEKYDAVRRHSMSVEEREQVVFSLGGESLDYETAERENCVHTDITIKYLDVSPNCAMLNVLVIIEHVTYGSGNTVIPMIYNFHLVDDAKNVFLVFISTKLPIFYPEINIGKIKVGLSTSDEVYELDEKSARNVAIARSIIENQNKEHDSKIAEVEKNAKQLSDAELLAIFAEYFDFALKEGFLLQQGSPRYKAYFSVVNAATLEMLNNPQLYEKATKREHSDLETMCNNRIPGVTNSLICGLIFCMGKYAVVPSSMLCIDFAEAIPNCIAVYLLLTAQKLPPESRKQVIDAGDGVNTKPLKAAMDTLSICSPTWEYHIFPTDDDNKARDDAALQFASGTDNPAIKNANNTKQTQSLKEKAGVPQDSISEDTHPASSVTMDLIKIANIHMTNDEFESRKVKAVKCTSGHFYDGNKNNQCPYCKSRPEIASSKQAQWEKQGLCKYCGGKIGGLVTKKCKSCGKTK